MSDKLTHEELAVVLEVVGQVKPGGIWTLERLQDLGADPRMRSFIERRRRYGVRS